MTSDNPSRAPLTTRAEGLDDDALLDLVQRQSFGYFWDHAFPASGLVPDRIGSIGAYGPDAAAVGGSGFGVLAIIVGAQRGWVSRHAAAGRVLGICDFLASADRYHGVFPHLLNGTTGKTIPFSPMDDGGDLVETAYLVAALLCARRYFDSNDATERAIGARVSQLWEETQWSWHAPAGSDALYWHWSPKHGWGMKFPIRGWNECLIAYVLAASSPHHAIEADTYHRCWAGGSQFANGREYYGIRLPLGPDHGGPLFFAHYSFLTLDPRGLEDAYANYWDQNVSHTLINREHCVRNPNRHAGYSADCWGLTASDNPDGYAAHSPTNDRGVITPTAALSSFPYAPEHSMQALRHFYHVLGDRLWGPCGFVDAFDLGSNWYASTYLAIDQGPIVVMIENHRSAAIWNLFMSVPEIQIGLRTLGFTSPNSVG